MRFRHILALVAAATALAPLGARAADDIKIGFPIPLSGPTAVYGKPVLAGAELAVQEINAKGGVLGRKLVLRRCASRANSSSRTASTF
jgi:branched-chain amino acid transport system substrate-binding protein